MSDAFGGGTGDGRVFSDKLDHNMFFRYIKLLLCFLLTRSSCIEVLTSGPTSLEHDSGEAKVSNSLALDS